VAQSLLSIEIEPVEYDDYIAAPMRGIDRIIDGEIEALLSLQEKLRVWTFGNGGEVLA
jgi:hypothetical protein